MGPKSRNVRKRRVLQTSVWFCLVVGAFSNANRNPVTGVVSTFVNGESRESSQWLFEFSVSEKKTILSFWCFLLGLAMSLFIVVYSRVRCLRACVPCECHSSGGCVHGSGSTSPPRVNPG